jgi:tetratricopeptide (TPR) repeat protein
LGDYGKALADFNAALKLWPQEPETVYWRALTHREMNRPDQALADLNLAVQLDPLEPRVLRARASLLRDQGRFGEALQDYENALTFGGHDHRTWGNRGWLLLYKLRDYERAARDLRRATELSPSDPDYWYDYGVALFYKKDCQLVEVLERYRKLCESSTDCKAPRLTWAGDTVARFTSTGRCPG